MNQETKLYAPNGEPAEQAKPVPANPVASVYEWLETLVWCFLFVVLLFTFAFRVVGVDGSSMEDTLHNSDRLITTNYFTPKYGDIVAVTQPRNLKQPLVKRVIATEGQVVDIDFDTGFVYVDGTVLNETYIKTPTTRAGDVEFPVTVPTGKVFVLGDNREVSMDSRLKEVGMVDVRYIFGKVAFRLFPFNRMGTLR